MTGTIRFYLPKTRQGIVQTEDGQDLLFLLSKDDLDLQGGDLVDFQAVPGRPMILQDMTVRRRCTEALINEFRPLVNEFHNTVRIRA